MKTNWLVFSVLCVWLISCGNKRSINSENNGHLLIDTTKVVILPYDSTDIWIFKNCTQAELTNDDLELLDSILIVCISEYNIEQEKRYKEICNEYPDIEFDKYHFLIDITKYRRQYICVTNEREETETWINFLCESSFLNLFDEENPNRWKTGRIVVMDGGNCFFTIKINLTTKIYYDLFVNGEA